MEEHLELKTENAGAIQGLVMQLQQQLIKEAQYPPGFAHWEALSLVGASLNPPVTGRALQDWIMEWMRGTRNQGGNIMSTQQIPLFVKITDSPELWAESQKAGYTAILAPALRQLQQGDVIKATFDSREIARRYQRNVAHVVAKFFPDWWKSNKDHGFRTCVKADGDKWSLYIKRV